MTTKYVKVKILECDRCGKSVELPLSGQYPKGWITYPDGDYCPECLRYFKESAEKWWYK